MSKKSNARQKQRNQKAIRLSDVPGFIDTRRTLQIYYERIGAMMSSTVGGAFDMEFPMISDNLHIRFEYTPMDDAGIVNVSGSINPDDLSKEAYAFEECFIADLGAVCFGSEKEVEDTSRRLDECINTIFLARAAANFVASLQPHPAHN